MKCSLRLSALLLSFLSVNAVKGGPFTATISIPRVQEMGEDVTCQAIITNNHDEDYYFLKRNTPLEKLASHIFKINKGQNIAVKYDGFFVKRGPVMAEEYLLVPGKTSVSSKVVLSDAYSFDSPSLYSVQLDTHVLYTKSLTALPLSQPLSSNTRHFFLANTGKSPKLTEPEVLRRKASPAPLMPAISQESDLVEPTFSGDWPSEEAAATEQALSDAYNAILESINDVGDNNHYFAYFGKATTSRMSKVKETYQSLYDALSEEAFDLVYYGSQCKPDWSAYTCYDCTFLAFCEVFFSAPATGIDSKMGIIIHELTHAVANSDDIAYGQFHTRIIAALYPDYAIINADNYEYYSETL